MWGTLFIMFAYPHLQTTILYNYNYPDYIYLEASIFVICFCILYILFRNKHKCSFIEIEKKYEIEADKINNSAFEAICFAIFVISFLIILFGIIRSVGSIWNASWGSVRSIEHDYFSLNSFATRIIITFSGFSLYYFLTNRKKLALFVLALFLLYVLIKKSRADILPILIFIILLVLMKIKHLKPRHFILGAVSIFGIIYIVYSLRAFRWLGTTSNAISNFSWDYINNAVFQSLRNKEGELGLYSYFYYFIYHDNSFTGFNSGATYIRILLTFFPRQLTFGLKPESFDLTMGRAIGMASGGSMHPTLFGDSFGNFWWFGVLLGVLWAFFANFTDRLISCQKYHFFKIMIYFMTAFSFVLIGRGSVYNGFQYSAWGILIIFILKYIYYRTPKIRFRLKKKNDIN